MQIGILKYKLKFKKSNAITSKGYAFLLLWVVLMSIIFIVQGFGTIQKISEIGGNISKDYNDSKNESLQYGNIYPNSSICRVGIFVNDIRDINMKDSKCTVDFDIWFIMDKERAPADDFQVIDAYFEKVEDKERFNPEINRSDYFRYHVVATIKQNFDTYLYPFDKQLIKIKIKDRGRDINSLKYDRDDNNSNISDRLNIAGFIISEDDDYPPLFFPNEMKYNTNFGNTSSENDSSMSIYSQFNCIIPIEREEPEFEFYRLFQGLIFAVLISLLALFIKPTWVDPRFGLGVGALFAAIANNYIVTFSLPSAEYFTLSDVMHGMGIRVIFITLAQSVISLHIYDRLGEKSLSKIFDIISFMVFSILYASSIFYVTRKYDVISDVQIYIIYIIIILIVIFYLYSVRNDTKLIFVTMCGKNDSNK